MIVLLTGNEFAVLQEQKRRISEYLRDNDAFGLERLDAEDLEVSRLREALMQLPFLVTRKLVVIRGALSNKVISEALMDTLDQVPDEVDVVLIDPKADKRTRLYKQLSQAKSMQDLPELKGSTLEKWVSVYAEANGSSISESDARYLVERIGAEQMILAREIEKLSYGTTISRADIEALTDQSLRSTVFDLLDKTFAGRKDDALKLYDDLLANKTDPSEVLALVGWQLHVLALVKYAGEGSSGEIASKTGLHPFVTGKAIYVARRLSAAQIKSSVASALDTDIKIKTTAVDAADAVRVLLLEFSDL